MTSTRMLLILSFAVLTAACLTAQPTLETNKNASANANAQQSSRADNSNSAVNEAATGSIEVTSNPPGARVLLVSDSEGGAGEPQPRGVTPTTITRVDPGPYVIDLERPGYRFFQKKVIVKAGETVKVTAILRKQ